MNTKTIPVYLDCNYETITRVISILSYDSWKELNKNKDQLSRCLSDELKERYNGGSIKNKDNLTTGYERLASGLNDIMSKLEYVDKSVYEGFRDYIEKILNYNKPIDRNEYPHLTDEMIEEIYNFILSLGQPGAYCFTDIEDINQRIDALKLVLSRSCGDAEISSNMIFDAYISANSEDRKTIYDLLRYTKIGFWPNIKKSDGYAFNSTDIDREKFDEIAKLIDAGYDKNTVLSIYYTLELINNNKHDYLINEITPVSLKFGDFTIDIPMNELMKYCKSNKQWLGSPGHTFDYLSFFSDNIYDNKILDDTVILFNLNGMDFKTNPRELRAIIEKWKERTYPIAENFSASSARAPVHDTDVNLLDFMGYLIRECRESVHTYALDQKIELDVLGKKLNMTLWDFAYYFDEFNGHFDIKKLINEGNLSDSEYVYYNSILGWNDRNKLQLTDLNVLSNGKALDFFNEYGSVYQCGVKVAAGSLENPDIRDELINFCKDSYNLTEDEAYIIMRTVDSGSGQCTMADTCNTIYELYDYDNEKFQNDFGYSMFRKELKRGADKPQDVINDENLLLDLYIQANTGSVENGDTLLLKDGNGKIIINEEYLKENRKGELYLDESHSYYFGYDRGLDRRYNLLNNFLKSKNNDVLDQYDVKCIDNKGVVDNDCIQSAVLTALNANKPVSVNLWDHYHMFNIETGDGEYTVDGGHAVTLVGLTEEGALVNSWGKLYYVPKDEIDYFYILDKKSEGSGTIW